MPLSKKQLAQRKYAAAMRSIRARAKKTTGGRGRIGTRSAATKLRRKLGLTATGKVRRGTRKTARRTKRATKRTTRKVGGFFGMGR